MLTPLLVTPRLSLGFWLWCAGTPLGSRDPNLEEFGEGCCLKFLGWDMDTYMCFLQLFNIFGRTYKEPASVVGSLRKGALSAGMRGKLPFKNV